MKLSRRQFLDSTIGAAAGLAAGPVDALVGAGQSGDPKLAAGEERHRATLAERFPDLRRHFVFEYYPWYQANPYVHWNDGGRQPPIDIASNYIPQLGPYSSSSLAVMEQHAKWIAETGVGAINVSWWGRDVESTAFFLNLMDVMRAHDIHVAFHIEPYATDRALRYASDIEYLITQYGDRRHWDCFLLLQDEDGSVGPVFKSFDTILAPQDTDCHGIVFRVPNYAADSVWRQQTDRVRTVFASDFDRITLLADSTDHRRVQAGGFDGFAIYDNYLRPEMWRSLAKECVAWNLVFSFNCNPGFDAVPPIHVDPASCDLPRPFEPGGDQYDWSQESQHEAAAAACARRILESFDTTLALQTATRSANVQHGFFLTYINSFNEWHEGHQFEPMKNARDLTAAERARGYHNPENGRYRIETLTNLMSRTLAGHV